MEKSVLTQNFSMRFGTSMFGVVFTDTFFAHRYSNDQAAEFKVEMARLAYALMHNSFLTSASPSKSSKSSARSSPGGCQECDHELIPLKYIQGYEGCKQQRCILCNTKTSWCCRDCTTGPLCLVPVCPKETVVRRGPNQGKTVRHGCLARHRANPALLPTRRQGAKRARSAPGNDGSQSSDGSSELDGA
ncbi:hypothetical protein AB1Y20_018598 [Prymnesium parvum]|uniref:Uncharacterized protein n=1 Tax=Prymnesium parvum TaxID=97485 RepID=A0AB34JNP4_PRYPA